MAGEVSKKILWIFVFLILAAIAVVGVLFIRSYHAGKQITAIEVSPSPELPQESPSIQLIITNPTADVATTSAKITIAGKSTPNASIAITGGAEDYLVVVGADGNFSQTVNLSEGLNNLVLQAYTEDGATAAAKKNIVYTKGTL